MAKMCIRDSPYIGRLQCGRMRDLLLEFLRRKACSVSLRKRQPVVFHIIADRSFDPVDPVNAAGYTADHIDPVDILHSCANDGTVVFFRQFV